MDAGPLGCEMGPEWIGRGIMRIPQVPRAIPAQILLGWRQVQYHPILRGCSRSANGRTPRVPSRTLHCCEMVDVSTSVADADHVIINIILLLSHSEDVLCVYLYIDYCICVKCSMEESMTLLSLSNLVLHNDE